MSIDNMKEVIDGLAPAGFGAAALKVFFVHSDDDSAWTTALTVTGQTSWGGVNTFDLWGLDAGRLSRRPLGAQRPCR